MIETGSLKDSIWSIITRARFGRLIYPGRREGNMYTETASGEKQVCYVGAYAVGCGRIPETGFRPPHETYENFHITCCDMWKPGHRTPLGYASHLNDHHHFSDEEIEAALLNLVKDEEADELLAATST